MSDIFISYDSSERTRVRPLAERLQSIGWDVWWDPEIPVGQTYREVIRKELESANCVLVVWSNGSISSEWVIEEADVGKKRGILVPVVIDSVEPPLGFRSIQTAQLLGYPSSAPKREVRRLLRAIETYAGSVEGEPSDASIEPTAELARAALQSRPKSILAKLLKLPASVKFAVVAAAIVTISIIAWNSYRVNPTFSLETEVIMVRHAVREEGIPDPGLSEEGQAQSSQIAQDVNLVQTLRGRSIDAVYSTDFARTRQTAERIAESLSLSVTIYDPIASKRLAEEILRDYAGKAVVVIGHANTIPDLVLSLGGSPPGEIAPGEIWLASVSEDDVSVVSLPIQEPQNDIFRTDSNPNGTNKGSDEREGYSDEITEANIQWESRSYIRGRDFGLEKGQIYARVRVGFYKNMEPDSAEPLRSVALIPISDETITYWSDNEVVLNFTDDDIRRLRDARDRASKDMNTERADGFMIDYQIETNTGKKFTVPHRKQLSK